MRYRRIRRALVWFTILSTLYFSLNFISYSIVQADSSRIKKIISVVYDDSGSMSEKGAKKWAYANYAMQSFTALTGPEDVLYMTSMSRVLDGTDASDPMDLNQIEESVKGIRNQIPSPNGTPFAALQRAFDKLMQTDESNPYTEYWLVILSDGQFFDEQERPVSPTVMQAKLESFAEERMPNGGSLRSVYLGIGSDASKLKSDTKRRLFCEQSSDGPDIIQAIAKIADQISGRARFSDADIRYKSDMKVELSSKLPLRSIAVLSQGSLATIQEAELDTGGTLRISRAVSLNYPEHLDWVSDTGLLGVASLLDNSTANIPPGNYTLDFANAVKKDELIFLYEPAISLRLKVSCGDQEVKDVSLLEAGEELRVEAVAVESGTDTPIADDILPKGSIYTIRFVESDQEQGNSQGAKLLDHLTLKNLPSKITAQLEIPGFLPISVETSEFTPSLPTPKIYSIRVEQAQPFELTRDELAKNEKGIRFQLLLNGERLPKEEAKKLHLQVIEQQGNLPYKLRQEEDGSWFLKPKQGLAIFLPCVKTTLNRFLLALKEAPEARATGTVNVTAGVWWRVWVLPYVKMLGALLLLLYFLYLVMQKRFRRQRVVITSYTGQKMAAHQNNCSVKLSNWRLSFFVPFRTVRYALKSGGPRLVLQPNGNMVSISKEQLEKLHYTMRNRVDEARNRYDHQVIVRECEAKRTYATACNLSAESELYIYHGNQLFGYRLFK